MRLRCRFDELDTETRTYLSEVHKRSGKGAIGGRGTAAISVAGSDSMPLWIFLGGVGIAVVMLYYSIHSVKEPTPVAMLQTAALMIGLWSVYFAVRRWLGIFGGHAGNFSVFDPLHVYQVQGETVTINSLESIQSIEARGNDEKALLSFIPENGRPFRVPVADKASAQFVEGYYEAMTDLEENTKQGWADAPIAELGAAARYVLEEDEVPRQEEIDLELDTVPETPHKGNRAGFGLMPLVLIVVGSVVIFGLCRLSNQGIRDGVAFNDAKQGGAPGLRGYLMDVNNTRHRDEAKTLIAKEYDKPINAIRNYPPPSAPELRDAMIAFLEELRNADVAVASIQVESKIPEKTDQYLNTQTLRSEVADGLARSIGPELIAFAQAPKDKPAHITITIDQSARPQGALPAPFEFIISIRPTLESEPTTATLQAPMADNITPPSLDQVKQAICTELTGTYKPVPVILPGDEDF